MSATPTAEPGAMLAPAAWEPSRAFLKVAIGLVLGGAVCFLALLAFYGQFASPRGALVLFIATVAAGAGLLLLLGRPRAAVAAFCGGVWLHATLTAFVTGGVGSIAVIIYPIVIAMAGWLIGLRTGFVLAALSIGWTLVLTVAEQSGRLPAPPPTPPAMRWLVYGIAFTLMAALVGFLSNAYRRQLAAGREAATTIARLNASLEARVRERTAQLEQANRDLESFSYTVSHDLRAPLRAMVGFSGLLHESLGERASAEERGYLARISASGNRMSELIDAVLEYSRLGRSAAQRVRVDLDALVAEIVAELREAYPGAQVRLLPLGLADVDPTMARQIFVNLIGNALKYSARKGAPQVEVGAAGGAVVEYYVRDNGIGFDMAHAEHIFELFTRLGSGPEYDSTGAGLAIVKRLVERHGGAIRAAARPGEGAEFSFTFGGSRAEGTAALPAIE